MNREQYEADLKEKQQTHLRLIQEHLDMNWKPCLEDSCPICFGTLRKVDGTFCDHKIECDCSKHVLSNYNLK